MNVHKRSRVYMTARSHRNQTAQNGKSTESESGCVWRAREQEREWHGYFRYDTYIVLFIDGFVQSVL